MRRFLTTISLLISITCLSAQTVNISGVVYDRDTNQPINYGFVYTSQHKYVPTDSLGHYQVTVPIKGKTLIGCKLLGYKDAIIECRPGENSVDSYDIWMTIDSTAVFGFNNHSDGVVVTTIDAMPLLTPYDDNKYFFLHKAAIPDDCVEIIIYTQYRTAKTKSERALFGEEPYLCPYVIRFQDSSSVIKNKWFKGRFLRRFKKIPVENLSLEGFHLLYTDLERNDPVAQQALGMVRESGLHYNGKQGNPLYYFKRDGK